MNAQLVVLSDLIQQADSGFASGSRAPDGILQVRMNCVDSDGSLDLNVAPRVPPIKQVGKYLLKPGDVVFNSTNSPELVGKSAVFEGSTEPVTFSNHFLRLRAHSDTLDPRYLARWLASRWKTRVFERMCTQWVNQASIRKERLLQLKIPLPPLAEQQRIAALLDKADGVRRKRRESLRLLDELLRSAFLEMFGDPVRNEKGWEVVRLGDIGDVQGGLQVSAARTVMPSGIGVPYLRVANVYRDRLDLSEMKELRVTHGELERTLLRVGDVLVVEGHGNRDEVGRSALWDGSIGTCVHQNHLIRVRAATAMAEPTYLSAYLNSAAGRRQMLRFGKTTSGLNTISTGNVRRVKLALPPVGLQRQYSALTSGIRAARDRVQQAQTDTDHLLESLAQRAFQGA